MGIISDIPDTLKVYKQICLCTELKRLSKAFSGSIYSGKMKLYYNASQRTCAEAILRVFLWTEPEARSDAH